MEMPSGGIARSNYNGANDRVNSNSNSTPTQAVEEVPPGPPQTGFHTARSNSNAVVGAQRPSFTISDGQIVTTNCDEQFRNEMDLVSAIMMGTPCIRSFIADKQVQIVMLNQTSGIGASIKNFNQNQIVVQFDDWFLHSQSTGRVLAMMAHEFGVHTLADALMSPEDHAMERDLIKESMGSSAGQNPFLSALKSSREVPGKQTDHIFASHPAMPRNAAYMRTVCEMAVKILNSRSRADDSSNPIDLTVTHDLLFTAMADIAMIRATADNRSLIITYSSDIACCFNKIRVEFENFILENSLVDPTTGRCTISAENRKLLHEALPGTVSATDVILEAFDVGGSAIARVIEDEAISATRYLGLGGANSTEEGIEYNELQRTIALNFGLTISPVSYDSAPKAVLQAIVGPRELNADALKDALVTPLQDQLVALDRGIGFAAGEKEFELALNLQKNKDSILETKNSLERIIKIFALDEGKCSDKDLLFIVRSIDTGINIIKPSGETIREVAGSATVTILYSDMKGDIYTPTYK